ncbi:transposase [Holospora curviuscula]|uniref:transposase n=1 Tax=Holospora curviuscula TaxID=1082868 RepID=UPI0013FDD276
MWPLIFQAEKALGESLAKNNRKITNAVFWILRAGAPWRNPPLDYDGWSNTYRLFYLLETKEKFGKNYSKKSLWSRILSGL